MTNEERERRDSRALEPELITDPQQKAAAEARNGFRQYDAAIGVSRRPSSEDRLSSVLHYFSVYSEKPWRALAPMPATIVLEASPSREASTSR